MKRIFTLLAAAVTLLTASAQNAGDYVYTDNGKFKIVNGENLLSNGDFSQGTDGWTTDGGNKLSVDTFAVEGDGLYLTILAKDNGPGTGSSLYRKVSVSAGTSYLISYQVKGNDDAVATTVTTGDNVKNYQNIFFNTDGSLTPLANGGAIAKVQTYGFDWTTISYGYKAVDNGFVVLHFFAPYIATCFDNFKVMQVQEVPDDREAAKVIAKLQKYLDDTRFPNGHDILEGVIGAIQAYVEGEDLAGYNEMVSLIDEAVSQFLDANTANVTTYLKNGNFDDLTVTNANQRKAGAWTIDDATPATGKTRWAVKDAVEQGVPLTGKYLQDDIPYGTNNILKEATVHQTVTNMPAAQYMFNVKMRAYKLLNKAGDRSTDISGLKVFINNDSTECTPVDDETPQTYTAYTTLTETGSLKVGFYVTEGVANHIDFDVTDLRIVGWTQEQLDEYMGGKEFAEAKAALKHGIDSARVWHADELMLYGKPQLDSAIVASQNYYDNISIVDSLIDSNKRLLKEISNYISRNATLTTFRTAIANAEMLAADNTYAETDRRTLQTAIDAAKAYLGTLSADNHLTEGFTNADIAAQTATLNEAVNALLATKLVADEKFLFYNWAAAAEEDATFVSLITEMTEEQAVATSGGSTLYPETGAFAGHELNGRFAFLKDVKVSLNKAHGMEVNFNSKNKTTMAILNLKEGDQVVMDWAMGNATHGLMCVSANAKVKLADGTWQNYTKTGKDNANVIQKDNTDGLSGSTRSTFIMNAEGTLDFYQSSSNSTIRIYYIGITNKENVTGIGVAPFTSYPSPLTSEYYDLQGRRYTTVPAQRGIYIFQGRKVVVK